MITVGNLIILGDPRSMMQWESARGQPHRTADFEMDSQAAGTWSIGASSLQGQGTSSTVAQITWTAKRLCIELQVGKSLILSFRSLNVKFIYYDSVALID